MDPVLETLGVRFSEHSFILLAISLCHLSSLAIQCIFLSVQVIFIVCLFVLFVLTQNLPNWVFWILVAGSSMGEGQNSINFAADTQI